jgi:hypothetical protein
LAGSRTISHDQQVSETANLSARELIARVAEQLNLDPHASPAPPPAQAPSAQEPLPDVQPIHDPPVADTQPGPDQPATGAHPVPDQPDRDQPAAEARPADALEAAAEAQPTHDVQPATDARAEPEFAEAGPSPTSALRPATGAARQASLPKRSSSAKPTPSPRSTAAKAPLPKRSPAAKPTPARSTAAKPAPSVTGTTAAMPASSPAETPAAALEPLNWFTPAAQSSPATISPATDIPPATELQPAAQLTLEADPDASFALDAAPELDWATQARTAAPLYDPLAPLYDPPTQPTLPDSPAFLVVADSLTQPGLPRVLEPRALPEVRSRRPIRRATEEPAPQAKPAISALRALPLLLAATVVATALAWTTVTWAKVALAAKPAGQMPAGALANPAPRVAGTLPLRDGPLPAGSVSSVVAAFKQRFAGMDLGVQGAASPSGLYGEPGHLDPATGHTAWIMYLGLGSPRELGPPGTTLSRLMAAILGPASPAAATPVRSGARGGSSACGVTVMAATKVAVCGWASARTVGALVSPLYDTTRGELAVLLVQMRYELQLTAGKSP